ncbi:hypothetical protein CIW52_07940 [Mycolicibacterium sp. P9-64]|uniref:hypothetical protein n=1 Tax=Mycolicibacterium sp. P9-64 TaxID=2024612 RepID=UPI0011ED0CDE|nr:hypothetical protein [Mycolicibacterium sp. P9-64]KAA0085780.1 hypothetical protein CIW52_07940 [Mycolicibacterium sp. P9-64]
MNRQRSRAFAVTSGLSACGLAVVVVLTGCSAGQVSQTAIQEPAVNGTNVVAGDPTSGVALRNVHLRAPQTSDYVQPGSKAELLFVAVNESPAEADRLVSITSEVGSVVINGNATIRPAGTLVVGTPDGQPSPLDASEDAKTVEAAVTLTQPISNGLTYPFTFTFERSGSATVAVPISAGEAARRDKEGASGGDTAGAVEAQGGHG